MPDTVLITGGQGFVGRALVNRFADLGHTVICTDLHARPFREDVRFQALDVCDAEAVNAACAGVDTVIHNASLVHTKQNQHALIWAVNHGGARNVLAACARQRVPRLVYISSASAVYEGRDIENGDEKLPYSRISQAPYADAKIAAEKDVLAANGVDGVLTCAIRPHVIFGEGDNRFIPAILEKARNGKLKREVGRRDKLSDFTYISNLVDAVAAAAERLRPDSPVAGQAYFVTNGEPMAFFEFVERFLVAMGYPRIEGRVPYWVAYSAAAVAEAIDTLKGGTLNAEDGLTRFAVRYLNTHHYYCIDKAARDLGYRPAVSLDEGIRLTARAFAAQAA